MTMKQTTREFLYSKGFSKPINECSFGEREEYFIYRVDVINGKENKVLVEGCGSEYAAKRGVQILQEHLDKNREFGNNKLLGDYKWTSIEELRNVENNSQSNS